MQYEAPAIEDLGSIADHTFQANPPGVVNNPFFPDLPGNRLGQVSGPS